MSLAEVLVVLVIFGILTAIASPIFTGIWNRNRVNDAFNELQNAMREAQARAVQSSRRCTITIAASASPVTIRAVDSDNQPCIANRTLAEGVALSSTSNLGASPSISFSFKGNTTTMATLAVYWSRQPTLQRKCLTVSGGVGIIRLGNYTADPTTNLTAGNCKTAL